MPTASACVAACPARGVSAVMFPAMGRFQIFMAIRLSVSLGAWLDNVIAEPLVTVAIKQPPPPPPPPPPPSSSELGLSTFMLTVSVSTKLLAAVMVNLKVRVSPLDPTSDAVKLGLTPVSSDRVTV